MRHSTELIPHGTDYTWVCTTCDRKARHQLPLYLTEKKAKEHERKYNAGLPADDQDSASGSHVITIEHKYQPVMITETDQTETFHRWTCSCGCPPGKWKLHESQAQSGGKTHVRHKERR